MKGSDPESCMWDHAFDLLERAHRLNRWFFSLRRPLTHLPAWEPPIDVFETERDLWILVALPGVEPGGVEVTVEGRMLTVSGERLLPRTLPPGCEKAMVHRLEIPHGRFERRIELPSERLKPGRRDLVLGCLVLSFKKP